jgi:hypothetical protein
MPRYVTPPRLDPDDLAGIIDPNRGFLCLTLHWRPDPEAPDPEMPGQKLSMNSYITSPGRSPCLCGSGKHYRDCCRPNRLWRPICPNPGGTDKGFSLVKPQKAVFRDVDGNLIRERLMAEPRLRCTDDSLTSGFWILFGDPPVEGQYGILCFGDVELKRSRTLVATAMSDLRMRTLLALLDEIAGDVLGKPRVSQEPIYVIDKATGKMREVRPSERRGRRRRRKR